jgi:integrase
MGALAVEWVTAMRRRGLAPGTIAARRGVLARWRGYLGGADVTLTTAGAGDVERWLDTVPATPSARYTAISHLHAFYRWANRAGVLDVDPTVNVERPRLPPRLPRPIHPTDLAVAVLHADGAMLVGLLLAAGSGLRCCEIARLRWDDVHDGRARVLGKGSRERVVPLHPSVVPALDELDRSSVFVLPGWQSRSVDNPGLRTSQILNGHLRALGISATAHQLRHYAGTHAYRGSHDLRAVQQLLGHSSPATTALYTALDVDDLTRVVDAIPIGVA